MILDGNKAYPLSPGNHFAKTIHHHHHNRGILRPWLFDDVVPYHIETIDLLLVSTWNTRGVFVGKKLSSRGVFKKATWKCWYLGKYQWRNACVIKVVVCNQVTAYFLWNWLVTQQYFSTITTIFSKSSEQISSFHFLLGLQEGYILRQVFRALLQNKFSGYFFPF